MVRKVLSAKNGVITEERFKKMNFAQWLFHYVEALKADKEKNDQFEVLISYMELVGSMANPEAGKKLKEWKDQQKYEKEITVENFAENFASLKDLIPKSIEVKFDGNENNKFILPKYDRETETKKKKRKVGIDKGGEN